MNASLFDTCPSCNGKGIKTVRLNCCEMTIARGYDKNGHCHGCGMFAWGTEECPDCKGLGVADTTDRKPGCRRRS